MEARTPKYAKSLVSSGAANADFSRLNQISSNRMFQQNESGSYQFKQPPFRREMEGRGGDSNEIVYGTVEEWGRATENFRRNKIQFSLRSNMSADPQTISEEEDAAYYAKPGKTNIVRYFCFMEIFAVSSTIF